MKILVINGPNMNMLGIREPEIYGKMTYADLVSLIKTHAENLRVQADCVQSNHEGAIVDMIQSAYGNYGGIVINPAAYTHTSIAIADALRAVGIPAVEVHISDPSVREDYRRISYVRDCCEKTIAGHGFAGYTEAITYLAEKYGGTK